MKVGQFKYDRRANVPWTPNLLILNVDISSKSRWSSMNLPALVSPSTSKPSSAHDLPCEHTNTPEQSVGIKRNKYMASMSTSA